MVLAPKPVSEYKSKKKGVVFMKIDRVWRVHVS